MHTLTHSWKGLHALITKVENRWTDCLNLLKKELPEPFFYVYARSTFGLEAKQQVEEIADRVNATLVESIRNMATIQNNTKESLLKKLAGITTKFGYSDSLFDMTVLEGLYSQVPYLSKNSSFLELLEKVSNNSQGKMLKRFFKQAPPNPIWIVRKGLTDCDDCSRKNHLEFPMDLFQPPFFEEGLPWSLNFGGFGAIFAHALIHDLHKEVCETPSKDQERNAKMHWRGSMEDAEAACCALHPQNLAQPEESGQQAWRNCRYPHHVNTCALFDNDDVFCKNKSACFLQQYRTAMEPEFNYLSGADVQMYLDANDTETATKVKTTYKAQFEDVLKKHLDSNIADVSGLSLALSAYTQLLQDECEDIETRLEGLEQFSGLALFFTTRAMSLCGANTGQNLLWWLTTVMGHSPYHHRVNLPLQNLEAFAKAFNCSEGSAMYKQEAERCSLW
uniref:Peptidase M13 C-terminal domain-containing protein n=1 Tax=Amblyomma maculatum TaxID=34609 RepID=G3MKB5_AMBMU